MKDCEGHVSKFLQLNLQCNWANIISPICLQVLLCASVFKSSQTFHSLTTAFQTLKESEKRFGELRSDLPSSMKRYSYAVDVKAMGYWWNVGTVVLLLQ